MQNEFLNRSMKAVAEYFAQQTPAQAVTVDRDRLRTTLIQCELEVREMHRVLKDQARPANHRQAVPSSRY